MKKDLSEMTLEELWELFPISLAEHEDKWEEEYQELAFELSEILSGFPIDRISHIGSTAIKGIMAKAIVDVLVEMPKAADLKEAAEKLAKKGFLIMSQKGDRVSLNRGYTKDGFADRVCHVHLRHTGDNDELYFRDYLNDHPQVAKAYEDLKLELWKKYEHDRDAYTAAKTDFVRKWTEEARREYGTRY